MASHKSTSKRRKVTSEGSHAILSNAVHPLRGALSGLRSWLSPWRGNSKRSAAFGEGSDENSSNEGCLVEPTSNAETSKVDKAKAGSACGLQTVGDVSTSMYPTLPLPAEQLHSPSVGIPSRSMNFTSNGNSSLLEPSVKASASSLSQPYPFTFTSPNQIRSILPNDSSSSRMVQSSPKLSGELNSQLSPLSRNYTLLARFFAEKAAEEAGRLGEFDNRLTEEEIRGCYLLIEESGRSVGEMGRSLIDHPEADDSYEKPRRKGLSLRRSWLSTSPGIPYSRSSSIFNGSGHGAAFLPSQSHSTAESNAGGSCNASFLAHQPSHSTSLNSSTEPALFARSLVGLKGGQACSPFWVGRASASTLSSQGRRRRHRPLYLGPGMSSTSLASSSAACRKAAAMSVDPAREALHSSNTASRHSALSLNSNDFAQPGKRQRFEPETDPGAVMQKGISEHNIKFESYYQRPIASSARFSKSQPLVQPFDPLTESESVSALNPQPSNSSPFQKTRTATAVLSILSQSDLAKPTTTAVQHSTRASASSIGEICSDRCSTDPADRGPGRSDSILNPYQSSPDLNLHRISSSAGRKSRTAEAVERIKDERRRSARSRKSLAPSLPSSSATETSIGLLEKIEQTMPSPSPSARRDASRALDMPSEVNSRPSPSTPKVETAALPAAFTTPTSTPPFKATTKSAEEKTAEAKRRLEAMSTNSKGASSILLMPSPASTPSYSFTNAHIPPKPSRLSIAFNANESPGSTGTRDEEEDDDEAEHKPVGGSVKPVEAGATLFSFGPTLSQASSTSSSASSTPSLQVFKPATDVSTNTGPSFSFLPLTRPIEPATAQTATLALPNSVIVSQPTEKSRAVDVSAKKAALSTPATSLPTFDLSVTVAASSSPWFSGTATTQEEQQRGEAVATSVTELPGFDLSSTSDTAVSPAASIVAFAASSVGSINPTPTSTFTFSVHGQAQEPTTYVEQASGEAVSDAADAGDIGASSSALLGSGEGEEGESTLFEVRAKFWRFASGKWEDLGVGIARVKRRSDSDEAPRRLLVRNVGNGAVSVNFNIVPDFTAKQEKAVLSFTGFDADGKGLPMRCKVKTKESAVEFKNALEGK